MALSATELLTWGVNYCACAVCLGSQASAVEQPTMPPPQDSLAIANGGIVLTALLTAGGSNVLRRPETRKGLNSGLALWERRDQTGKNAVPLSPKPQVAGSIPVPPAREV
jgi:hypothetical protein